LLNPLTSASVISMTPRAALTGQRALVTGGSRGIGWAIARDLAERGAQVTLVARDPDRLARALAALPGSGHSAHSMDIADANRVRSLEVPAPDLLVLSHGVMSERMSKTLRTSDEEWRRVLAINLDGAFTALSAWAGPMVERRSGRIVALSACLGRFSGPGTQGGLAPYRVSKAALNALIRNFAHETGLGARGVTADLVCPGHCRTDMGGPDAPRSAEEGAETATWLLEREFIAGRDRTGLLWEDREVVPF
jgi:NAD(P)-dependent dehydrogenase (short-subunit alcohol dehydrogenase family)